MRTLLWTFFTVTQSYHLITIIHCNNISDELLAWLQTNRSLSKGINSHAVFWNGHILITLLLIFDCFVREWEKSSFFLIIKKLMKATEYRGMISNSTSARSLSPSCLHYGAGTGRSWPGHQKNLTTLHKVCVIHI